MPNLKDLRIRIDSVKSTQKITSAMKMVAAAKLRRAQEQAEAARPYSERMEGMLTSLAEGLPAGASGPPLLVGNGMENVHLLLVMTSNRGLCGGFNSSIVREAKNIVRRLLESNKEVKILCIGRKGRDILQRDYKSLIIDTFENLGRRVVTYLEAKNVADRVLSMFAEKEFDICTVIYNHFRSAMTQVVTPQQLIPFRAKGSGAEALPDRAQNVLKEAVYEFEPDEKEILEALLPQNLAVQIFHALLENAASEQGARMTAMDSATRNAGEMIDDLTMTYNRTRQAVITKELIEIISGAEAL